MSLIPASIRTNNPGAMYPGPSAKKFGATRVEILKSRDGEHKIACFDNPVHGAAAQFDLLSSPKYTGRSVRDAITKWCGGFYVSTYINVLEQNSGVTADTVLTTDLLRNPDVAIPLAKAMAQQEAGRPYPMADEDWQQAHKMAFGVVLESPVHTVTNSNHAFTSNDLGFDVKFVKPSSFTPENPMPSPKPETRIAEMKAQSRKWSLITTLRRWFVGVPFVGLGASEIPAVQEQLNAFQTVSAAAGKLGLMGWLLVIFFALGLVQKFMVEDVEEGRSIPSGAENDPA